MEYEYFIIGYFIKEEQQLLLFFQSQVARFRVMIIKYPLLWPIRGDDD